MTQLRAAGRLARLIGALLYCLIGYALALPFGREQPWVPRFLAKAAGAVGADVRVVGHPEPGNVLFVANHISWIDILALGGATGAAFVSKDAVARWPVVGWLARIGGTIFISRESRGAALGQAETLRAALATGRPAALFPEGTTGDGRALLPFRAALFGAVTPPPPGVRVQPVAVDYGDAVNDIAWIGQEGAAANALRVIGRRGRLPMTLNFLTSIDPAHLADRKAVSAATHDAIGHAFRTRLHAL